MSKSRWFRVPNAGSGTMEDPDRPKYSDQVDNWSGQQVASSPRWIVRFYAEESTLDSIESNPDATTQGASQVANALNGKFSRNYSIEKWERKFRSGA